MNPLVFRRRKCASAANGRIVIGITLESYDKILEVADESGESLKQIASKMIEFAYENVSYETEE